MSVRPAARRSRRRVPSLALAVLAAALVPAAAAQASWPGLNGWQSFSSNRFDTEISGDIFVMPPIGLPQVQLTTARPDDAQSAWSPDGRRIAFKSRPGPFGFEAQPLRQALASLVSAAGAHARSH